MAIKPVLREIARRVYELNGATVRPRKTRGAPPNSQLEVTVGTETKKVAVRTSLDNELAVTRRPDGEIAIIPKVDEVAVVCPALDGPDKVEIRAFAKDVVIAAAEEAFERQKNAYPDVSPKTPVFIPLDTAPDASYAGLSGKFLWRKVVPLSLGADRTKPSSESVRQFRDRVRREYAELCDLPVKEVFVKLGVVTPDIEDADGE